MGERDLGECLDEEDEDDEEEEEDSDEFAVVVLGFIARGCVNGVLLLDVVVCLEDDEVICGDLVFVVLILLLLLLLVATSASDHILGFGVDDFTFEACWEVDVDVFINGDFLLGDDNNKSV